jgi:hypothetical protein
MTDDEGRTLTKKTRSKAWRAEPRGKITEGTRYLKKGPVRVEQRRKKVAA